MSALKTIGILGGMGPGATILLQQKLLDAIDAKDDCDHIPLLIDMNPQTPSRMSYLLEGKGDNPGPVMAKMAKRLETAGATALALPCNTAHYFANYITDAVNIPFLNVISATAQYALNTVGHGGTVGMLAMPASRKTRLFETALAPYDISVIWPSEDAKMLGAIKEIKATGPSDTARNIMIKASQELRDNGAQLQLISCSEFSIISDAIAPQVTAIDTIDLLVEEIIRFATPVE